MRLRSPFLHGLAPLEVNDLVAAATAKRFRAHSVVTSQEQPADRMFMLTSGRARFFFITEGGHKLLLHWIMPGEIFGGIALAAGRGAYFVSTEMLKDGTALAWDYRTIRGYLTRYPRLLDNALTISIGYSAVFLTRHVALSCHDARQRLAQVLITLARAIGQATRDGIELDVTNEELATTSAVTVFTASRLLNEWQRQGALAKSRGKILLRFPERLFPRGTLTPRPQLSISPPVRE